MSQINQLKEAIKDLYLSVDRLRTSFPKRKFTPDGRMIGDIGEAIASLEFNVIIDEKSKKHWDGHRIDSMGKERKVQVKTTQKDGTYLKEPPGEGNLLVFKIYSSGIWECCYDGPILRVWKALAKQKPDNTGAKLISLNKLKEIQ